MSLTQSPYARALRIRGVAPVLFAGLAVRLPLGAAGVVVVLHVVDDLHRSYAMAGLVATTLGIVTALGSPWRGRLVDRVGLRRSLGPSIAVLTVVGSVSAWVGYWPLLTLTAVSGVYAVPALAIVRSALDAAAGDELRSTVMALDAIAADVAYMLGPACGIAVATGFGDRAALTACLIAYPAGALLLWLLNPTRSAEPGEASPPRKPSRGIPGGTGSALIVALAFASAVVDSGGELSTVAAMTQWHQTELIGLVISIWAVGSIVGGLIFGALPSRPGGALLMLGLAGTLALTALAGTSAAYALLLGVNGLFVAPTYAAISADLTVTAPPGHRAEALSWQSGAMMLGTAVGTPSVGLMIDHWGWPAGLLMPAAVGLGTAVVRAGFRVRPRSSSAPDPTGTVPEIDR